MTFDKNLADRIKGSCERMLLRAEPDIPLLQSKGNWKALSGVSKGACRDALQMAMLEIRCNKDIDAAKSLFLRGRDAAIALASIPESEVPASSFDIPIFCSLLSGDIDSAKRLASVALSGKVIPGSHFDIHAKVLSGFVLDSLELVEKWLVEFRALESIYWWKKQSVYFDLYKAVLEQNSERFNSLLSEAIKQFKVRGSDVEFGDQLGEYGGLEYNQFAIDFMAVGIAVLASSKGIDVYLDDEMFPLLLFK